MKDRVTNEQVRAHINSELAEFDRLKIRREDVKDIRLDAFEDLFDARARIKAMETVCREIGRAHV